MSEKFFLETLPVLNEQFLIEFFPFFYWCVNKKLVFINFFTKGGMARKTEKREL